MDAVGLLAIVGVLVVGTAVGLWRRRAEGRFHDVRPAAGTHATPRTKADAGSDALPQAETEADVKTQVRVAASVPETAEDRAVPLPQAGVRQERDPSAPGSRIDAELLASLGVEPAGATLLQFSSAFCAPCRSVRRVSAEVAGMVPGVRHVEVDAESHLDAVRALGIWRTPTLLIVDGEGRIAKRATGVPTKPHLIAALAEVL